MGKWFLDFSFWIQGYRTVQTVHCAVDQKFFLPMLEHFSFVEIQNLSSLGLDEAECLSYKIAYLRLPY